MEFESISGDEAKWIERPFDDDKVISVVKGLNGDKAMGPNGFSLLFFHFCWNVVKSLNGDKVTDLNGFSLAFFPSC